jgi:hypothetical protein
MGEWEISKRRNSLLSVPAGCLYRCDVFMKGSMTVEAAFVFPFCFFVLAIIGCLGVYKYNQSVLKVSGYECVLKTMEERNLEEQIFKENFNRRMLDLAQNRTLGMKDFEVSIKMTATKLLITVKGVQRLLNLPVEVEVVYQRVHPEKTLQLLRE